MQQLIQVTVVAISVLLLCTISFVAACDYRRKEDCVHGICDRDDVCTCSKGWYGEKCEKSHGGDCSVRCFNGKCDAANCVCDAGWVGHICQAKPTLKSWCDLMYRDIDTYSSLFEPDTIASAISPHTEFMSVCHRNDDDKRKITKEYLESLSKLIKQDLHDHPKARRDLLLLWTDHPDIRVFCCPRLLLIHKSMMGDIINFQQRSISLIVPIMKNSNYRKMLDSLNCKDAKYAHDLRCAYFPYVLPVLDFINNMKIPELAHSSSWTNWQDVIKKYQNLVHFYVTLLMYERSESKFLTILKPYAMSRKDAEDLMLKYVNDMITHIQKEDFAASRKLYEFFLLLPIKTQVKVTCNEDIFCLFLKTVEQFSVYETERLFYKNGKKAVINTQFDYKQAFTMRTLEVILPTMKLLHSSAKSLAVDFQKQLLTSFKGFKAYLVKVQSLNKDIAESDMGDIQSNLKHYEDLSQIIIGEFRSRLTNLLTKMMIGAGINLGEAIAKSVLAIAQNCNPIGWLTGGADPVAIIDALEQVSQAIAQLAKGGYILNYWNQIKDEILKLQSKLSKDSQFLDSVTSLVKNDTKDFQETKATFLSKYDAFSPAVNKDDIVTLTSLFSNLVSGACAVVEAMTGAIASQTITATADDCVELPVLIDRMSNILTETREFQDSLTDSLVGYVKAKVAINAAEEIDLQTSTKGLAKLKPNDKALQFISALTLVSYKVNILKTINEYCALLQYTRGGKKSSLCNGLHTDVAALSATKVPTCIDEIRYVYVPTTPSDKKDAAYLDLENLFKGNIVQFKIPNSQWLVDHGWVNKRFQDYTHFVKSFELYLPVSPDTATDFTFTGETLGLNFKLDPQDHFEYTISPKPQTSYEYSMGRNTINCHTNLISNPYTFCKHSEQDSFVCPYTKFEEGTESAYPSVYSNWAFEINGAEKMNAPSPATKLDVIMGIHLCRSRTASKFRRSTATSAAVSQANKEHGFAKIQQKNRCCSMPLMYRNRATNTCTPCPKSTDTKYAIHSTLAGYYCEKYKLEPLPSHLG